MTNSNGTLRLAQIDSEKQTADWLAVPYAAYADQPSWIPPLNLIEKQRISPKHSPFFTFGEAAFFIAYRDGRPIGRITAQVNRRHLDLHQDATGHFGFFDCVDDPEAATSLVNAAATWLKPHGLTRMLGPLSFSTNEECGCLIAGFDTPPAILMPHAAPWTQHLLEAAGLAKEMDLFVYRTAPDKMPSRIEKLVAQAAQFPDVTLRHFDMRRYNEEIRLLVDIFNDAWSENWGFVPFSSAEIDSLAAELRPFFRNEYGRFVLVDGEPAGFAVALPDVTGITASFHGRLFPFNWIKLIWSLKRETYRSARIPLMGIRRAWQSTPRAGALLTLLVNDLVTQCAERYKLDWIEYGWILESNRRMVVLAQTLAGPPQKTYRIYAKPI
jgi:GNAT superfamily N-acetyltransferase